ncbi:hypothetical protein XF24_00269 [candidate division SR1 bacterium Aalborg_AAW-1]|nr:hypothetical protein XF24_00269 [candidate division SR1 bacterium Aalborg_AAW-1]
MNKFHNTIYDFNDLLHDKVEKHVNDQSKREKLHDYIDKGIHGALSLNKKVSDSKQYTKEILVPKTKQTISAISQKIINNPKKSLITTLLLSAALTSRISIPNQNGSQKDYNNAITTSQYIPDTIDHSEDNKTKILVSPQRKKELFGDYIAMNKNLQQFSKKTEFGRRVRTLRYHKNIHRALEKYAPDIRFESFLGLYMVEGEGNTASINHRDGGAGLLHIQPDVAKKDLDMKIFTDHPDYKRYEFDLLKKQGYSTSKIYALHGKIIKQIVQENDGQERLAGLDERFHPQICLDKVAQRMQKDYIYAKKKLTDNQSGPKEQAFKKYVKETLRSDVFQYAAINGYNKGTRSFLTIATKNSGNHMKNVQHHITHTQDYTNLLNQGIANGLEKEDLWNYIIENSTKQ